MCSPLKLRIYSLAVDGRGRGSGFAIPEIARIVHLSEERVRVVLRQHERDGYIAKVPHTKRPIAWVRGPCSNILDELIIRSESNIDGETVNPNFEGDRKSQQINVGESATLKQVRASRAHLNGRIMFEVSKLGDMNQIRRVDAQGRVEKYNLFPKEPYLNNHNTEYWKTDLPYHGREVPIELICTKKVCKLSVFGLELSLTKSQIESDKELMENLAVEVTSDLVKFGGWVLGPAKFIGKVEHAFLGDDCPIDMPHIEKRGDSRIFTDHSHGERELETTDHKLVATLCTLPEEIDEIKDIQKEHSIRLLLHEDLIKTQGEMFKTLSQLQRLERESEKSRASQIEDAGKNKESESPKGTVANGADNEVMYR